MEPAEPDRPGIDRGFVRVEGGRFTLHGQPYRVAGGNCYYLGYCPDEAMAEAALDTAAAFGANVLRIWAFLEADRIGSGMFGACFQFFDPAQNRIVQVEGEQGLQRLDRAVQLASERGHKLILTLTNNFPDCGGMDAYLRWLAPGAQHDDFYILEDVAAAYENWARSLLERTNTVSGLQYKHDPAIFAWELANEPRSQANDPRLRLWIERMSEFLKRIDPHHLVTVGDEGFSEALLQAPHVDFGTYHLYPQSWGENCGFGLRWIRRHTEAGKRAGKPVLLEEFGLVPGEGFVRDSADRDALYAEWMAEAAEAGGSLVWMLGGQGFPFPDKFCLFDPAEAPRMVAQTRAAFPGFPMV